MININLLEYLSSQIGNTTWCGDTLFDDIASDNLDKLDNYLKELEDIREVLLQRLYEHKSYNKGNASAEELHKKAGKIIKKHLLDEDKFEIFESYWESNNE